MHNNIAIIGAGIAGCELALTLAKFDHKITIFEQKPLFFSQAHTSTLLSELVCSNSLRNNDTLSGIGLLKDELRKLNSFFIKSADLNSIPAGKALAVDRNNFSEYITNQIIRNPNIKLINKRIDSLNDSILLNFDTICLTTGPLTSDSLINDLKNIIGLNHCYFYDAIAPIVWDNSLNMDIIFRASRYGEIGSGDYLNCPMDKKEYENFYNALINGNVIKSHEFEKEKHFEGCMPIEALASRGIKTLTFGPFKPVGLIDPKTNKRPWAVLQLRAEDKNSTCYNLVGCQTKLIQSEQLRIFRLIPGLENAEFARFGSMHRNTYVNSPNVLNSDFSLINNPNIFLAGQITGVEGYVESAASGLYLALLLHARHLNLDIKTPPNTTAIGALINHTQTKCKNFQPSNAHFGLMPEPNEFIKKKDRKAFYEMRAKTSFDHWLECLKKVI